MVNIFPITCLAVGLLQWNFCNQRSLFDSLCLVSLYEYLFYCMIVTNFTEETYNICITEHACIFLKCTLLHKKTFAEQLHFEWLCCFFVNCTHSKQKSAISHYCMTVYFFLKLQFYCQWYLIRHVSHSSGLTRKRYVHIELNAVMFSVSMILTVSLWVSIFNTISPKTFACQSFVVTNF